jgi:hypothetical protein
VSSEIIPFSIYLKKWVNTLALRAKFQLGTALWVHTILDLSLICTSDGLIPKTSVMKLFISIFSKKLFRLIFNILTN